MKILRILCSFVVVFQCMELSNAATQPPTIDSGIAQQSVRQKREAIRSNLVAAAQVCEMVKTTNSFYGLSAFANSYKSDPANATNEFLLMSLVEAIRLRVPASVTDLDLFVIPSRVRAGKMRPSGNTRTIRQDVLLQGGRAAWFIEQLLDCELAEVSELSTQEEIEDVVFDAYYRVREVLLPPGAPKSVENLSLGERRRFAEDLNSNDVIVSKLSRDTDPSVRKRIASNKNAPVPVLARLARDKDSEVRRLALKNLEQVRSLSE